MRKLASAAADAAKGAKGPAEAFAQLGVSAKNADGSLKSTDELLLELADAFARFEDGAGKASIAQDLFGKSGTQLIPFLNQGRAGIEDLRKEAEQFGVIVSGSAAAAADDFNDNLARLGAAVDGLGNKTAEKLLPALVGITDEFVAFVKDGDKVAELAAQIEAGFKSLATVAIVVKSTFSAVGEAIGNLAGAAATLARGLTPADFASPAIAIGKIGTNALSSSDALRNLGRGFADIGADVKSDLAFIDGLWNGFDETLQEVEITAKRLKGSLTFKDAGANKISDAAAKASDQARESVEAMLLSLRQQVDLFDQGETAVIRYRIANGDLAATFALAGEGAQRMATDIVALTSRLELMKDTSESVTTAIADFAEQNQSDLDETLASINLDLEKRLGLTDASEKLNTFYEEARRNAQDILGQGIYDTITSGFDKGAGEALEAFGDMLLRMGTEAIAADIMGALFKTSATSASGSGGGSGDAGWIASLASLFGGGRATGGPVDAGVMYRVNEREPEFFKPNVGGKVIPLSKMSGGMGGTQNRVTQNITVAGRADLRTARQMQIEAARQQRIATSRLG